MSLDSPPKPQLSLSKRVAAALKEHGAPLNRMERELAWLIGRSWKEQQQEGGINWDALLRRSTLFELQKRIVRYRMKSDFNKKYIKYLIKEPKLHKDFQLLVASFKIILQEEEKAAALSKNDLETNGTKRWTRISLLATEQLFEAHSTAVSNFRKRRVQETSIQRGKLIKVSVRGAGLSGTSHKAIVGYRALLPASSISIGIESEDEQVMIPKYSENDVVFFRQRSIVPGPATAESELWKRGKILSSCSRHEGKHSYDVEEAENGNIVIDLSPVDLYSEQDWELLNSSENGLATEITLFVDPDSNESYLRERGWFEVSLLPGRRFAEYHHALEALQQVHEEAKRNRPAVVGKRKSIRQRTRPASKSWPPSPGTRKGSSNMPESFVELTDQLSEAEEEKKEISDVEKDSDAASTTPRLTDEAEKAKQKARALKQQNHDADQMGHLGEDDSFELLELKGSEDEAKPAAKMPPQTSGTEKPPSLKAAQGRPAVAADEPTSTAIEVASLNTPTAGTKVGNEIQDCSKNNILKWDPVRYKNLEGSGDGNHSEEYLSPELKELAFLLEQAGVTNVGQQVNSWKHVDRHMSPLLRTLVESKHHLASFRQHGKKMRCLVGENLKRRDAFNIYRAKVRRQVFGVPEKQRTIDLVSESPAPIHELLSLKRPAERGAQIVARPSTSAQQNSAHSNNFTQPPRTPQARISQIHPSNMPPHAMLKIGRASQSPAPAAVQNPTVPNVACLGNGAVQQNHARRGSALSVSSVESIQSVVVIEQPHGNRPRETGSARALERRLNPKDAVIEYLNTLKEYDIFSSSIRREAYLSIHLARWNSWHVANAPRNDIFLRAADMTTTRFCEDEIVLAAQTHQKGRNHLRNIPYVLVLVETHFFLRRKILIWWCSLVKSCYIDFASQFPRIWTDFQFSQRSLWEYYAHIEIAMRDSHTDSCCSKLAGQIDSKAFTTSHSRSTCMKSIIDGLAIRPSASFVHRYLSNLCQYHDSSCSLRKQSFLRHYVDKWKSWIQNRPNNDADGSFLAVQESMVEQFRVDESSLIQQHFRAPYLGQVDTSNAFGMPWFTRELEFYFTMREKMWFWFSRDILVDSWKRHIRHPVHNFEEGQTILWKYFDAIEEAMLQVHVARCAKDVPA